MNGIPYELFQGPRIRSWLPNETLFSLASRQHALSGNWNPSLTCSQLFGHARHGSAHDFPSNLDILCNRVEGQLGSIEQIVHQHTILPFYLKFRSAVDAHNAVACVRAGGIAGLKGRLCVFASRFGASHPLKACSFCMAFDENEYGIAYWHLDHQIPGVWYCPVHGQALQSGNVKATGVGRFCWYLPKEAGLSFAWPRSEGCENLTDAAEAAIESFGECALALTKLPSDFHFDQYRLTHTYRARCAESGLTSEAGRLRHEIFGRAILPHCLLIRSVREMAPLPHNEDHVCLQFSRMLSTARAVSHPFRHIVMILALFGSWAEFWRHYIIMSEKAGTNISGGPANAARPIAAVDARLEAFLALVQEQSLSVSAASKKVGIDTQTGMAWATKAGHSFQRRPKILTSDIRKKLVAAIRHGKDKKVVATTFGLSVQTITNVLRTEVGLYAQWHDAQFLKAQSQHRRRWTDYFLRFQSDTQQDFKRFSTASFAWLYRNDREWLIRQAAVLAPQAGTNNSNVHWDTRDEALSKKVLQAGLAIRSTVGDKRITLGQLCQSVLELKPKLSRLKSLPLTQQAIFRITRSAATLPTQELF